MRALVIAFPTLYVERWPGQPRVIVGSPRRRTSSDVAMPPKENSRSNTGWDSMRITRLLALFQAAWDDVPGKVRHVPRWLRDTNSKHYPASKPIAFHRDRVNNIAEKWVRVGIGPTHRSDPNRNFSPTPRNSSAHVTSFQKTLHSFA